MSVDKKKLLEYLRGAVVYQHAMQFISIHVENGRFDADPEATIDYWKRLAADQQALKEKAEKERDKWHGYFDQLNRDSQEANGHYAKVARTIWSGNDCPSIDQIADRYQELQRERDEAQSHAVELAKQVLETEKERNALQEERDHLLDNMREIEDESSSEYACITKINGIAQDVMEQIKVEGDGQ